MRKYIKLILLEIAMMWINKKSRQKEKQFFNSKESSLEEDRFGSEHVAYWKITDHLQTLIDIHVEYKFKK